MDNRVDVVRAYLASFATGDPEAVAACVTADFVNEHLSELGSGCEGRDDYRRRLADFLSMFVRARYSIVTLAEVATPDTGDVVVRYQFEATWQGTPIDIPGVMWFQVRDGLISRRTDLWDSLTFLRQTGQADRAVDRAANTVETPQAIRVRRGGFGHPGGMAEPVIPADDELRERLTPLQYEITQRAGTERAFSGTYWDVKDPGTYHCIVCDEALFSSETKYDSGSGWPSFTEAIDPAKVTLKQDRSHGMVRTEAVCATCGAHLGHVFPDGPGPSGDRFCMNSASLDLKPPE